MRTFYNLSVSPKKDNSEYVYYIQIYNFLVM